jgi:hypothetical protein
MPADTRRPTDTWVAVISYVITGLMFFSLCTQRCEDFTDSVLIACCQNAQLDVSAVTVVNAT